MYLYSIYHTCGGISTGKFARKKAAQNEPPLQSIFRIVVFGVEVTLKADN